MSRRVGLSYRTFPGLIRARKFAYMDTLFRTGVEYCRHIDAIGDYVYVACHHHPLQAMWKIYAPNNSDEALVDMTPWVFGASWGDGLDHTPDGATLYDCQAGLSGDPGLVVKWDVASFTEDPWSPIDLKTGEETPSPLLIVGDYAYVGSVKPSPPIPPPRAYVGKIDLATYSETADSPLLWNSYYTSSLSAKDGFLYACSRYDPQRVAKINLSTFTVTTLRSLSIGATWSSQIVGNNLYVMEGNDRNWMMTKVNLATFTEVGRLETGGPFKAVYGSVVTPDGLTMYCCCRRNPGLIYEVDITTYSYKRTLTLPSGSYNPVNMVIVGDYLFVALDTSPGGVARIDIGF